MIERMIRAAKLEVSLYEEVEANPALNNEALQAVVLASVLAGLGAGLQTLTRPGGGIGGLIVGLIIGALVAVAGYLIWAYLTFVIGTRLFKGTADYGELRRTLGYAYAPNAVAVLRFIPGIGGLLAVLASLWALVAGVVAVRQALDFDTGKAILTVIVGWIVVFLFVAIAGALLAGALV